MKKRNALILGLSLLLTAGVGTYGISVKENKDKEKMKKMIENVMLPEFEKNLEAYINQDKAFADSLAYYQKQFTDNSEVMAALEAIRTTLNKQYLPILNEYKEFLAKDKTARKIASDYYLENEGLNIKITTLIKACKNQLIKQFGTEKYERFWYLNDLQTSTIFTVDGNRKNSQGDYIRTKYNVTIQELTDAEKILADWFTANSEVGGEPGALYNLKFIQADKAYETELLDKRFAKIDNYVSEWLNEPIFDDAKKDYVKARNVKVKQKEKLEHFKKAREEARKTLKKDNLSIIANNIYKGK